MIVHSTTQADCIMPIEKYKNIYHTPIKEINGLRENWNLNLLTFFRTYRLECELIDSRPVEKSSTGFLYYSLEYKWNEVA